MSLNTSQFNWVCNIGGGTVNPPGVNLGKGWRWNLPGTIKNDKLGLAFTVGGSLKPIKFQIGFKWRF